ncbi:MAG TPA: DUF4367 domain-containing protein [Herpetosiphonaceae bacterium]
MPVLHRSHRRMYPIWIGLLVALLLSACGAPAAPSPSPAPSASPSPAAETPTAPQTSQEPTAATEPPTPQSAAFAYLWPTKLPAGFEIRPAGSSIDSNMFTLELHNTADKSSALLVGGKASPAAEPPTDAGQRAEVTVRGVKGMAYQRGAGYSLYWEEQGTPYAIIGGLSLDQNKAITEALQSVDFSTWESNLAEVSAGGGANPPAGGDTNPPLDPTPPPQLDAVPYLWPMKLPEGLAIDPTRSSADQSGFSLDFRSTSGTEPIASLVGGKGSPASQHPTDAGQRAEVTVRGVKGLAYQHGAGYSLYWEEQGTPYAIIGGLSLDQNKAITEALQSVDLATWQSRLAEIK